MRVSSALAAAPGFRHCRQRVCGQICRARLGSISAGLCTTGRGFLHRRQRRLWRRAPGLRDGCQGLRRRRPDGYNWQVGRLVLGIEGDLQYTSMKATESAGPVSVTGEGPGLRHRARPHRLRLGSPVRSTAQAAGPTPRPISACRSARPASPTPSWSSGYAVGGGLEWAAWDRWSVKAEYLYVHSGRRQLDSGSAPPQAAAIILTSCAPVWNYRF